MLDSTIIEKVGKYLTPDDKIMSGHKVLEQMMKSTTFKSTFAKRCREKLLCLRTRREYYRKYKKDLKAKEIKKPLEAILKHRELPEQPEKESSSLQERITKLDFLFKKVSLAKTRAQERMANIEMFTPKDDYPVLYHSPK
ncbi:hypothetical protein NEOKW01_0493 [Nematocida sp. AWRm80]|nr:hypothetical protein NEOKW01_0493 [Nematocida sp. AWRm80]